MATALEAFADDREQLQPPGAHYTSGTLSKHPWVWGLWQAYCQALDVTAWPYNPPTIRTFIRFLGFRANYRYGTIANIVCPSLKRIYRECIGHRTLPTELMLAFSTGLEDLRRSRSLINKPIGGKAALLVSDLDRIISAIPDWLASKTHDVAVWLFAISTGARAITISHIDVADIESVFTDETPQGTRLSVRVRLRVTKGCSDWNHLVTIQGLPELRSNNNAVFWLNQALKLYYNLDLTQFEHWDQQRLRNVRLFPWERDALTQRLQVRAEAAGYPKKLFGFHSMRAGFITNALIKAACLMPSSPIPYSVLETTALVAGWMPGSKAQIGYVNEAARALVIGGRLIDPTCEQSPIDPNLISSERYHSITLQPIKIYSTRQAIRDLKISVIQAIKLQLQIHGAARRFCSPLVKTAWQRYRSAHHITLKTITDHLADQMTSMTAVLQLHEQLVKSVQADLHALSTTTTEEPVPAAQPPVKRRRWSATEEEKLRVLHEQHGKKWTRIAREFEGRSSLMVKDKWRNMTAKKQRTG
jgi:hypothetical protein